MYSRRIKNIKKKTGRTGSNASSSIWGPRLALEEREAKTYGGAVGRTSRTGVSHPPLTFKNPFANRQYPNHSEEQIDKPLRVRIPNRPYDYAYNAKGNSHKYDSLPSTNTWASSDSEDEDRRKPTELSGTLHSSVDFRRIQEMRSLPKESETIEVPVPRRKIEVTLESHVDLDTESGTSSSEAKIEGRSTRTKVGSPFGISMVYVPMERTEGMTNLENPDKKRDIKLIRSHAKPELRLSGNSREPKDPDSDSLLGSFDSVIFKPSQLRNEEKVAGKLTPFPTTQRDSKCQSAGVTLYKKNIRFSENFHTKPPMTPVRDNDLGLLSCGHPSIPDNYSTMSSVGSVRMSREDEEAARGKSALQQLRELSMLIGGSFHGSTKSPDGTRARDTGSRYHAELSSQPGAIDTKLRKCSSTTATSGDSGKGSASGHTHSNRSSCSPSGGMLVNQSILDQEKSTFKSECQECITGLLRNSYEFVPKGLEPEWRQPSKKLSKSVVHPSKSKGIVIKTPKTKTKWSHRRENRNNESIVDCSECNCTCTTSIPKLTLQSRKKTKMEQLLPLGKSVTCTDIGSCPASFVLGGPTPPPNISPKNLFTITEEDESNNIIFESNNQPTVVSNKQNETRHFNQGHCQPSRHAHPKCWLAPDPTMGWSDLESLYSQNIRNENPAKIDGECWTCVQELVEARHAAAGTDSTMQRTKRMFIWLNKRPKEFLAPWWESKQRASISWILAKADPNRSKDALDIKSFRHSKRDKIKLRLRPDIIRDLTNGKFYTQALRHLYLSLDPSLNPKPMSNVTINHVQSKSPTEKLLSLWEIIKILSRKGVYVALPSDMKLTEGTLRQRRPLRIAAHVALIEAIMDLYAKELLSRERVIIILNSFGHQLRPGADCPEDFLLDWINSAITTLKTHICNLTTSANCCPASTINTSGLRKWLTVGQMTDMRDLSDGVGIGALFALYFSRDVRLDQIKIPEPGETLSLYQMNLNHYLISRFCYEFFPERIYHLDVRDFLWVHGYMKQNIIAFLVDLFLHLEHNPVRRVNRLAHLPLRIHL